MTFEEGSIIVEDCATAMSTVMGVPFTGVTRTIIEFDEVTIENLDFVRALVDEVKVTKLAPDIGDIRG